MRTCAHIAKTTSKKIQKKKPLINGGYIALHTRKKKPKKTKKTTEWVMQFSVAYGKPIFLWCCIHPESGNLVICPKYWPNKFQIEKYFNIEWKKEELFNDDESVKDKWGAAVEII